MAVKTNLQNQFIVTILAVLFTGTVVHAQETLTVQALIEMKATGVSDDLLITTIQTADVVNIPADPGTFRAFQKAGISEKVMKAALDRKKNGVVNKTITPIASAPVEVVSARSEAKSSGSYPETIGMYAMTNSGWEKMERIPIGEISNNFGNISPFAKRSIGHKIDGPEAAVITSTNPQFCIVSDSEVLMRGVKVVELAKRGKNRELSLSSTSAYTNKQTDSKVDGVQLQKLSDHQILVKIDKMKPGQYAVMVTEAEIYDFTVKELQQLAQQ